MSDNVDVIVKGDDTYFNGAYTLRSIRIVTDLTLTGWTAKLTFQNVVQEFSNITSKIIQPNFTKDQTSKFKECNESNAKLELFDSSGNKQTQFTDLYYSVTSDVEGQWTTT